MRKNTVLYVAFSVILAGSLLLAGCGKKDDGTGSELLDRLNQNSIGLEYRVDSGNISSKAEGEGYRVTFKDAKMIMDTAVFKETSFGERIKAREIPIDMEEINFLYKPEDDYLELLSVKMMHLNSDLAEMIELPDTLAKDGTPEMNMEFKAGSIEFSDYDISDMLNYRGDDIWEFAGKVLEKNQAMKSTLSDLAYNIDISDIGSGDGGSEDLEMEFSADRMEFSQKSVSSFFVDMYREDTPVPDVSKMLEDGEPLVDMTASMNGMEFSFSGMENGEKTGGSGALSEFAVNYYLRPNEERTHFNLGLDYHLGAVKLDIQGEEAKEAEEILEGIRSLNIDFSLKHLSPGLIGSYIEMSRNTMTMQDDPESLKQESTAMGKQMLGQFMQSQPVVSVAIDPLEHEIGTMEINADFSMPAPMIPDGRAVLRLYDLEDVLASLKEMKGVSEQDYNNFSQWVGMMLQVNEEGTGVMTFEMKKEEPGVRYLNGVRMN